MAIIHTTPYVEAASNETSADQEHRRSHIAAALSRTNPFVIWLAVMTSFIAFVMIGTTLFPEWVMASVRVCGD